MDDHGTNTEGNTETGLQRRMKNLRPPWERGQRSPNPSGRPRRSLAEVTIQRMLRSRLQEDPQRRRVIELITRGLIAKAIKGDEPCARLLLERAYGKVAPEPEFEPIVEIKCVVHTHRPVLTKGQI